MIAINVPYRSQWDADAKLARGDCGIVAACMICGYFGIETTPDAMLRKAQLPVGRMTYTFNEVTRAAQAVGLKLVYNPGANRLRILEELREGRPAVTLLRYSELSGNQDDFAGAHFVTVVGATDTDMVINDPNWWQPRRDDGYMRHVPIADFERAIGTALNATGNRAYQSLFVAPK